MNDETQLPADIEFPTPPLRPAQLADPAELGLAWLWQDGDEPLQARPQPRSPPHLRLLSPCRNAAAMKNENRARNLAILSQLLNGSVSV